MTKKVQDHIDTAATELAECFRRVALDSVQAWQQVPLLALLSNGRSGYNEGFGTTASSGTYALTDHHSSGLLVNCRDGDLVLSRDKPWHAPSASVLTEAFDLRHRGRITAFDGNVVLEEFLNRCAKSPESYMVTSRTRGYWIENISAHRIGFVANWEERTDVLGVVSEHFVVLSKDWTGTFPDLVAAAVASADAEDAPEVLALGLMDPDLVLAI